MKRFYSIKHLSTEKLRELYSTYIKRGWKDFEYYELMSDDVKPPELSDAEIIFNIDARHEHNYCVLMIDHEDEKDGIMIGFGLSSFQDFAVYLHLPVHLLDELVKVYTLTDFKEAKDYTITEHLIEQTKGSPLN